MTDNTELQRLIRLRRLRSQIAASLPSDLDREHTFRVHGNVRKLLEQRHTRTALAAELRSAAGLK
jgi:hypothetical protein